MNIEQLSLFESNENNSLEVVQVAYVNNSFTNVDELFFGFNHLYAITFSYGLSFISKIIDYFDTAEIILGCEAMVKFDLKTIMAFQTRVLEELKCQKHLIKRVSDGTLSFWVAKEMISHQKIFILTSDDGRTRIIFGSANFSGRSFSGHQRENISFFDNDASAFDYYMSDFLNLKEFSTNEIVKDALYVNITEKPEEAIETLPIVKEIKVRDAGVILDNDIENTDAIEFTYDIQRLSSKYATIIPKLQSQNGKTIITPIKVKELLRKHRQVVKEQAAKQAAFPQFKINYDEGTAFFNEKALDFNVDLKDVKHDLEIIGEYFAGFDSFIGDTERLKEKYFRLLNYAFLSPFIARLRYEAYKNDFFVSLFPMYAVINGPKSAGKSAFLDTIQSIMFGQGLGGVDPSDFTKTGIMTFLHDSTGVPLHIEDISKERFNKYAGETIKYEAGILKERLINHPVFVLTSNNIESIGKDFAKRVYYTSVDATLTNENAATNHKKIAGLRKGISTSFYREYFRRMLSKVADLITEMENYTPNEGNDEWKPDIFLLSSSTILEIYNDCELECPPYINLSKYSNYFGFNDIVENIRDKIIFEWNHNRAAFKVLKKQNLLEYTAGEKNYEAKRICDSMPEILRPRCSGTKVIVQLDEAQKFFGIQFKKRLF